MATLSPRLAKQSFQPSHSPNSYRLRQDAALVFSVMSSIPVLVTVHPMHCPKPLYGNAFTGNGSLNPLAPDPVCQTQAPH
ncbi:MAG: hypothetical protein P8I59_01060 [Pseudomonadales bacterium]|nr:hypothetical protein [Pseudomonadales bacterium]